MIYNKLPDEESDLINGKFMKFRIIISSYLMDRMSEDDMYNAYKDYSETFQLISDKYGISNGNLDFSSKMFSGTEKIVYENFIEISEEEIKDIRKFFYYSSMYIFVLKSLKTGKMLEKFEDIFNKQKKYQNEFNRAFIELSNKYDCKIEIDVIKNRINII